MTKRTFCCWWVLMSLTSCATRELAVDVRTDYAAGVEFDEVVVTLDDARRTTVHVDPHDDFSDAAHVADYLGLSPGQYHVVAELRLHEVRVATADTWARLNDDLLVPLTITRDCSPTTCPMTDPAATSCYGGACFDPHCDPGEAVCMALDCETAAQCPSRGACVDVVCDRGACLYLPRDERCESRQYCNPDDGLCAALHFAPTVMAMAGPTAPEITVSWTTSEPATSAEVELSTNMTFPAGPATMRHPADTGASTLFAGLVQGTTYFARVRSTFADGLLSDWSATASATTHIDPPSGLSVVVDFDGAMVRADSAADWIYTPTDAGAGNYYFISAHAAASCASGTSPQYAFRATYVPGGPGPWSTGWQGEWSYIENASGSNGVRYWVSARCHGPNADSTAIGEASDCFTHGSGC